MHLLSRVMEPEKGKEKTSDVNVVNNTNQPHQGEIIQSKYKFLL